MKKSKLLALLLTLAMMITMMPVAAFAEEDPVNAEAGPQIMTEAPEDGTEANPFCVTYYRNNYGGYGEVDSASEIWFKMDIKGAVKFALFGSVDEYDKSGDVESIQVLASDKKTVVGEFEYNPEDTYYYTKDIEFAKDTYYILAKFKVSGKHGFYLANMSADRVEAEGTAADPFIIDYDPYADEEEDKYYTDYIFLGEDPQTYYYQLDVAEDMAFGFNFHASMGVGIFKIELLDSNKKVIREFDENVNYGEAPDGTANYNLSNVMLEKGKRYYLRVVVETSVKDESLGLYIYEITENGTKERPFIPDYEETNSVSYYYGWGKKYKDIDELWYKVEIQKDAKIVAYAIQNTDGDDKIDSATVYFPGDDAGKAMKLSPYGDSFIYDYTPNPDEDGWPIMNFTPVKKGDVVWIKMKLNDKAKVGDEFNVQISCFGISYADFELSRTSYTWNGKAKTPKLTKISYQGKDLVEGVDYESITYEDNVDVGIGSVVLKGLGEYKGTIYLSFDINPKNTKFRGVTAGKKSATVKWAALKTKMSKKHIAGYEIEYSTNKKFNNSKIVDVKGYKNTSKKLTKLKSGKKYYVHIRTFYKEKRYGEYMYSDWSKVKTVKVK